MAPAATRCSLLIALMPQIKIVITTSAPPHGMMPLAVTATTRCWFAMPLRRLQSFGREGQGIIIGYSIQRLCRTKRWFLCLSIRYTITILPARGVPPLAFAYYFLLHRSTDTPFASISADDAFIMPANTLAISKYFTTAAFRVRFAPGHDYFHARLLHVQCITEARPDSPTRRFCHDMGICTLPDISDAEGARSKG